MKQPPKIKLIMYFCLGLFILNACTLEEDVIKENARQEKMKLESKSFHELLQTSLFSTAYQKVINKKVTLSNDFAARTALEDQYGFTIVEDQPVKVITDVDGVVYYTISIERDVKEELKFENLVIKVDSTNVDAALFKYELNEKATYITDLDTYNVDVKETDVEPLQVDGKISFVAINCWNVITQMCDNTAGGTWPHDHLATQDCLNAGINLYYSITEYCFGFDIDTGGGEPPTGGTNGASNGGTPNPSSSTVTPPNPEGTTPIGESTPPIKTVIIPSEEVVDEESLPINHIKALKKLTAKPHIIEKIISYRTKLTTQYVEEGRMLNPDDIDDYVNGGSTSTSTSFNSSIFNPITPAHTVNIHMHQNLYYPYATTTLKPTNPIPSDTDVLELSLSAYRFNGNQNNTSIIVTRLGTFAIRITDPVKALAAINAMDSDNDPNTSSELQDKFFKDYISNVQEIFEQGDEAGAMQAFINFINTYTVNGQTMGLSIYQATFNSSGTSITNWVQL